jgi:hypothetical protein
MFGSARMACESAAPHQDVREAHAQLLLDLEALKQPRERALRLVSGASRLRPFPHAPFIGRRAPHVGKSS